MLSSVQLFSVQYRGFVFANRLLADGQLKHNFGQELLTQLLTLPVAEEF